MKILITGIAGFIGYNLARKLGNTSHDIIGIDNLNQYYDVTLMLNRLADLGIEQPESKIKVINKKYSNIQFLKIDITDEDKLHQLFSNGKFDIVIHLAAQAGV